MKRKTVFLLSLLCVALNMTAKERAKYVFYFIAAGMGVNEVNLAEHYLGTMDGRIGIGELCFASFPHSAYVTTYSATSIITASSAGGVALASGHKTKNGAEGVLKDLVTPITCIADWAHAAGAAVGIATSVTVDHATPAAFYAHVAHRSMAYEIGEQLTRSNFDFFAGSDFTKPQNPKEGGPDLYQQAKDAGFISKDTNISFAIFPDHPDISAIALALSGWFSNFISTCARKRFSIYEMGASSALINNRRF